MLNYRKHARFDNPVQKDWHHIHEQSNGGGHSVFNLALIDSDLNRVFLNNYFGQAHLGTGGLRLRDYLRDKGPATHLEWGQTAIAATGKTLHRNKDQGRGPYNEIE